MQYPRLHSKRCRYFQITTNTSSIGCLFFCLLLEIHIWFFLLAFLLLRPRRELFRLPASLRAQFSPLSLPISFQGVFFACVSLPTPTPWVFPLVFFLPRPLFSPRPIDKLPEWAFRLASLLLHPHRGFFCSLSSSHA